MPRPASLDDLLKRARAARLSTDLEGGRDAALQACAAAEFAGDRRSRIESGWLLCFFLYRVGALSELLTRGQATLSLFEPGDDLKQRVELLRWMSFGACEIGAFDTALQSAHLACEISGELGPGEQAVALKIGRASCRERVCYVV